MRRILQAPPEGLQVGLGDPVIALVRPCGVGGAGLRWGFGGSATGLGGVCKEPGHGLQRAPEGLHWGGLTLVLACGGPAKPLRRHDVWPRGVCGGPGGALQGACGGLLLHGCSDCTVPAPTGDARGSAAMEGFTLTMKPNPCRTAEVIAVP